MNKKVMAVAIAGALAAPAAMAQTSTVQIGGFVQIFYFNHKPENGSVGQSSDYMRDSESNLRVRGEEKLGGGLSAWFQCESSMAGIVAGGASSGFCTRNSGFGFKGGWGNAFVGVWDTPQKDVVNSARGWWGANNALNGGQGFTLWNGGPSGTANGGAGFFRRASNTVNYHSPSWNGFSVQGAFSSSNEQSGLPETNSLSPRLWSLNGTYRSGPLFVALGYERHEDFNPGAVVGGGGVGSIYQGGTDTNWTLAGGYRWGAFNIRGLYMKSDYDVTTTTSADSDGFGIFGDWNIQGPHSLRFQYVSLDDISGNATLTIGNWRPPMSAAGASTNTGVKVYGIAYSYAFSKRTEGSFVYNKLSNDSNANFTLGVVPSSVGNSQKSLGAQIRHRF